jgi:CBS domain-containing protein
MDTSLWMSRDLLTVTPATPVHVASQRMARRRVRHLLVVADEGSDELVGLASSHDLFLAAEAGIHPFSPVAADRSSTTVGAIMTRSPRSIAPSTPIAEAARILRDEKFGCLPVVDRGVLVGILTEHDILRAFLRMSGADQPGYEVTCVVGDAGAGDVLGVMHALATSRGLRLVSANVFDHDGKRYAVVRFAGVRDDAFVEALWASGLTILRVGK